MTLPNALPRWCCWLPRCAILQKPTPWYGRAALAAGFAGPWRIRFCLWYWDSLFPTNKPPDQTVYRLALGNNLQEPGRMDALKTMVHLSKADTAAIVIERLKFATRAQSFQARLRSTSEITTMITNAPARREQR
jgi:hypothetical protein